MKSVALVVVAVAACAVLGACGNYRFPGGGSGAGTGTVSGNVVVVPCAPVEKVDSPCAGRPVAGVVLVFTSSGQDQVTAKTDSAGNYATQLKPGTWNVEVKGFTRVISGPKSVTVESGGSVVANYVVDSGIRLPAAASG